MLQQSRKVFGYYGNLAFPTPGEFQSAGWQIQNSYWYFSNCLKKTCFPPKHMNVMLKHCHTWLWVAFVTLFIEHPWFSKMEKDPCIYIYGVVFTSFTVHPCVAIRTNTAVPIDLIHTCSTVLAWRWRTFVDVWK